MNKQGWCPMITYKTSDGEFQGKCITKDCAWWDNVDVCCAVFPIRKYVREIKNNGKYDLKVN
jgi:hypothetical protein